MDHSKLKLYSLARVVENKTLTGDGGSAGPGKPGFTIMATPIEVLTMLDGELKSNPQAQTAEGVDAAGKPYSTQVTMDNAVEAKWLPMGTNRRTAPDVRRGERVLLYQYADTNVFYWSELGWDDHLRKLETVVYSFSATQDESADSTDPKNCYFVEISTHKGLITLHTSKQNGEFCIYGLQINTKEGKVTLTDDLGNFFEMDSKETKLTLTNANNTTVQLDKQKIYAHADDSISLDAKNLIHLTTKDFKMECTSVTVKNQTSLFDTTATHFTGTVLIDGAFTAGSTATFKGNVAFQAPATFQQAVTFMQPIQCNGITSSAPIHGPSDTI